MGVGINGRFEHFAFIVTSHTLDIILQAGLALLIFLLLFSDKSVHFSIQQPNCNDLAHKKSEFLLFRYHCVIYFDLSILEPSHCLVKPHPV